MWGGCHLHTCVLRHQLARAHTHRHLRCTLMSKDMHAHVCAHTSRHSSITELSADLHGSQTGPPSCQTVLCPSPGKGGYGHLRPRIPPGVWSAPWGDKRTRRLCGETQMPDFLAAARENSPLPALPRSPCFPSAPSACHPKEPLVK